MEDVYAAELSLNGVEIPNTFFAVYDAHCGTFQQVSIIPHIAM